MPPSKDLIGRELSTGTATIDAEHVAAFAAALRDDNPAYRGAGATAPPTYPIAFMTQAMAGGMDTFLELGLNFMTLVHGEQEFEYVRPLRVGETLTLTGRDRRHLREDRARAARSTSSSSRPRPRTPTASPSSTPATPSSRRGCDDAARRQDGPGRPGAARARQGRHHQGDAEGATGPPPATRTRSTSTTSSPRTPAIPASSRTACCRWATSASSW